MQCLVASIALGACLISCGKTATEPAKPPVKAQVLGPEVRFKFRALDEREVSSDVSLGRNTVIVFLTTYDIASQAQARFLTGVLRQHVPRINAYAIILEDPESRLLAEAFVKALSLPYPVVLIDPKEFARTAFRDMATVPSILILDRGVRRAWRKVGLTDEKELEDALTNLDRAAEPKEL